jgi:hypothetical protein
MIMLTRDPPEPFPGGSSALRQLEVALKRVADAGHTLHVVDGMLRVDVNGAVECITIRSYGVFQE